MGGAFAAHGGALALGTDLVVVDRIRPFFQMQATSSLSDALWFTSRMTGRARFPLWGHFMVGVVSGNRGPRPTGPTLTLVHALGAQREYLLMLHSHMAHSSAACACLTPGLWNRCGWYQESVTTCTWPQCRRRRRGIQSQIKSAHSASTR